MDGPRAPNATEWPLVLKFLNQSLRPGQNWSIAEEYPLALTPNNLANIRIITDGTKVLSHAVLKYLLIKTPIGFFKVAAIGSVITDEAHRGQGLSHSVLDSCLTTATQAGCDFAILWTDLFDFYRKLGFELGGQEVSLLVDKPLAVPPLQGLRFLETNQIAPEALMRLYTQHTVGSIRTLEDLRKNISIPGSRIFTAWDEHNQIQAYAIEGKGADLKGYIHEWGGGVSKIMPLLNHIRKTLGTPLTVLAPAHAHNLIRSLTEQDVFAHRGYLGMMKVLHHENLIAKVLRYARSKGIEDLQLARVDEGLRVGYKTVSVVIPNDRDWVRLFFGPFDAATDLGGVDAATAQILNQILPIPMWIWGWDSV